MKTIDMFSGNSATDGFLSLSSSEEWEKSRGSVKKALEEKCYGLFPGKPDESIFRVQKKEIDDFCASHGVLEETVQTIVMNGKAHSFLYNFAYPNRPGKFPLIVFIGHSGDVPNVFLPAEEIIDRGYAFLSYCAFDVSENCDDFCEGASGILFENGERTDTAAGKIMVWAWASSLLLDNVINRDNIDAGNICSAGFSKTAVSALLAAAFDDRFSHVFACSSGLSGATLYRDMGPDYIRSVFGHIDHLYCKNFSRYLNGEKKFDYEQTDLLSLIVPRSLYIATAVDDRYSFFRSEFDACRNVSPLYSLYGRDGLVTSGDVEPKPGICYGKGSVGFHVREGSHYLSRYDWLRFIEFFDTHRN